VHVDLSGIYQINGLGNENYFILFCDDYSSYKHIYGLTSKTKEEVFDKFKSYIAVSERQTGCKLKQITLDRGSEFVNNLLGPHLKELGIELHLTSGYAPEENGVSERGMRIINTKARCMMIQSGLPSKFWFLSCSAAVFLTNRTVTKSLADFKTPFEIWHFCKPSISHLRVFGCQSFRLI
jgi:hypothetical protein